VAPPVYAPTLPRHPHTTSIILYIYIYIYIYMCVCVCGHAPFGNALVAASVHILEGNRAGRKGKREIRARKKRRREGHFFNEDGEVFSTRQEAQKEGTERQTPAHTPRGSLPFLPSFLIFLPYLPSLSSFLICRPSFVPLHRIREGGGGWWW
jgi:hypothetical protein